MVKLHGKKEYGHLTMMGNPSDDCINPYKWIQMVVFFRRRNVTHKHSEQHDSSNKWIQITNGG